MGFLFLINDVRYIQVKAKSGIPVFHDNASKVRMRLESCRGRWEFIVGDGEIISRTATWAQAGITVLHLLYQDFVLKKKNYLFF